MVTTLVRKRIHRVHSNRSFRMTGICGVCRFWFFWKNLAPNDAFEIVRVVARVSTNPLSVARIHHQCGFASEIAVLSERCDGSTMQWRAVAAFPNIDISADRFLAVEGRSKRVVVQSFAVGFRRSSLWAGRSHWEYLSGCHYLQRRSEEMDN